ncbi:SseB family protein [Pigmentibacter sp. JX0631]|uniref:SseB family protein n=1 Tax=Pigmentibacter sp. JX0631 TaxID=2976982 RepID=UPI00246890E6|nr:SseB family protein [Pigmentibacter sp. JX0631]WGL59226.1 SseB family protein [Pigmentibacter sp. JX0631]
MVLKSLFGKKDPTKKTENSSTIESSEESIPSESQPQQNEPSPALHLEGAMVENARNDNAETRAKVYQELLFSDLLLALADTGAPSAAVNEATAIAENPSVNVAILANNQGIQFAAAFTSAAAARRWRAEGGQYVSIRGQDVFKLLEPSPAEVIVINPGSAPFVVLNKVEYKQLAMGIVPQTQRSPVQVNVSNETNPNQAPADGMQIAFPPDAFNELQKQHALKVLTDFENIEAAALGAILPPNTSQENGWLRTIFLRVVGLEESQEAVQKFCLNVRDTMRKDNEFFLETQFEVGVMPDPNFWLAMHQNNFILLDKNPPNITTENVIKQ